MAADIDSFGTPARRKRTAWRGICSTGGLAHA